MEYDRLEFSQEPAPKAEIIETMKIVWETGRRLLQEYGRSEFLVRPAENTWNAGEEFSHTLRSAAAITSGLKSGPDPLRKLPRPDRDPVTYTELSHWYNRELDELRRRNPPNPLNPRDPAELQPELMLDHWNSTESKFESRLGAFSDEDLQTTYVPHPLLGAMYLREMLYFTIQHSMHHLRSIERKLKAASVR